jgi:hypothetical protein
MLTADSVQPSRHWFWRLLLSLLHRFSKHRERSFDGVFERCRRDGATSQVRSCDVLVPSAALWGGQYGACGKLYLDGSVLCPKSRNAITIDEGSAVIADNGYSGLNGWQLAGVSGHGNLDQLDES